MPPSKWITTSKALFIFLIISIISHQSIQQSIINMPSTIPATCDYRFDPQNRYSCFINNLTATFGDLLEIIGTHLPGRTDADVLAVYHVDSRINRFNGEVLRKFDNLRIVNLRLTNLQSISQNAFDVCSNFEELNIEVNAVTSLAPLLFQNCANFKVLRAFNNRIVNIPDNLFGNTRSLEVFDLHRNFRLSSIPGNLFQNMTNLRLFDVGSNEMSWLPPNIFINVANLEYVDVSRNNFNDSQVIINILNGHLGLRNIHFFGNLFPMFSLNFFTQFNRLESLALSGFRNSSGIAWQALPPSLRTLGAYGIDEEIPENAFNQLTNLTMLDLSGVGISVLQRHTFRELRNLDTLFVMYTRIRTIHPELFASQGKLRILFLNWNEIQELPDGCLAPLVNLGNGTDNIGLHFYNNQIQRLSASSFGQHPHLDYIDFAFNLITEIDRTVFSRFSPTIALIDFGWNICTRSRFSNATNLEDNENLQWCFNNYEGITTTTPNGTGNNFKKFEVFSVIFIGFLRVLKNFVF
ncbi:hypothetical protein ACKWTF_015884 [Chironomus riparius]